MRRTVTVELTDEDYALIEREAQATGRSPADIIATTIRQHASSLEGMSPARTTASALSEESAPSEEPVEGAGPIKKAEVEAALWVAAERIAATTGRSPEEIITEFRERIQATPQSTLTEEEQQAARRRMEAFFGSFDSGDPYPAAPAWDREPAQISGPITTAEVERAIRLTAERIAARTGQSPEVIISDLDSLIQTNPPSTLSEEARLAARQRMEALFGCFDSGDPHSADNERIDADLAREYGRGLDGDS
jgi:hypothetical protein